ncbi:MAG: hypothetical protein M0Q88_08045 [Bacilli bacterium]|nr:hypothetical protein [Bacilli bacterium]
MEKDYKVDITIDIKSKLRKIWEGKTFSDNLVLITELFQNSQRANAKNVFIELKNGSLTFKDDGCGCKSSSDVLTLDQSNWTSTNEGFGIGLWSWLAVKSVEGIEVKSNNWKIILTTKEIFENNSLSARLEIFENKIKGFEVTIYSHIFYESNKTVYERIVSDGEMQLSNVYLNGYLIPKLDLHEEARGKIFSKSFSNKYFDATLYPTKYGVVSSFYERRKIDNFYPTEYVDGVIEVKRNALTLQEPDRKNVIRDDKRYDFIEKLNECRKELYLEIVKSGDSKEIDEHSREIDMVLDVEDYEKYILVDDLVLEIEENSRNIDEFDPTTKFNSFNRLVDTIKEMNETSQLSLIDNQNDHQEEIEKLLNIHSEVFTWVKVSGEEIEGVRVLTESLTEDMLESLSVLSIGGVVYKKVRVEDYKDDFKEDDEERTSFITLKTTKKSKKKDTLKSVLKKTNRKVWVSASEMEDYADLISKVEYYGVKVFIARNVLHENVFKSNNIPYITAIEEGIKKTNVKWDVELKTKKEEKFIELLQPLCNYYNLPLNTFKIGNLKLMIETILDGKVINREIIENKKNSIKLYGVTDGEDIILDRRALGLQRFNLSDGNLGVNEFKALMANLKTISHELAHLLYNTEDNTKEHRGMEYLIYDEIVGLYLSI